MSEVKEGDIVIPSFMGECGECRDCSSEKSNLCSKLSFNLSHGMPRCGTSRFTDLNGQFLHHLLYVSSFSEYTVVDIAHIFKLDPYNIIPPDRACLLGCGVATGYFLPYCYLLAESTSTLTFNLVRGEVNTLN